MANEPVYVTFEFRGNLGEEVDKVKLGIQGLGNESAKTYQRLIADSSTAFSAMSEGNRKLAVAVQENINELRSLAVVQKALDEEMQAGTITTQQYTQSKAALAIQETALSKAIAAGWQTLNERIQAESIASDSVMQMNKRLQELMTTYNNLSKAEREGAQGQGMIGQIQALQAEVTKANQALREQAQVDNTATDSITRMNRQLQELVVTYNNLSKAKRDGAEGQAVLAQIQNLDKEVNVAQSRLSQYSRTAGTGFNSLSMSVQQVARELPSLTMGANMFFLAISNNLPILADNLKQARMEYDLMKKSGQTAIPVWKQVLSSIISWQTALVVGITLLSVYGKEVINWAAALFKGGEAARVASEAQKTLNTLHEEATKSAAKETAQLQLLYGVTQDTTRTIEERTAAAEKLQKLFPDYFGNLSTEIILIGNAKTAYEALAKSIENAASARILETKYAESVGDMTDAIKKRTEAQVKLDELNKRLKEQTQNPFAINHEEVGKTRSAIALYTERLNDANKAINAINKSYKDFQDAYKPEDSSAPKVQQPLVQSKYYDDYIKKLESLRKSKELLEITQDEFNKKENEAIGVMVKAAEATGISDSTLQKYIDRYKEFNQLEQQKKQDKTTAKDASKEQKAQEAANTIKAETAMRSLEIERQQTALAQKEKDAELDLRQQKLDLQKESADKELEQIALDYDRKINEIEKKGQEYILAQQKIEQAQWENANPDWKKKGLEYKPATTTTSQLPASQRGELSTATTTAAGAREKAEADLLEKTLKLYQDYAAKRLAVEQKYNDDVAYLISQRTDANKTAIDTAVAEAASGKKKALSELSMDELKDSDMWSKMFGDLDKMALPSLEGLLQQAREVNTSAWDPENVKEYEDAITRLEDAVRSRSPFKAIGEDWNKLLKGFKEGNKDDVAAAFAGIDTAVQGINADLGTIAGGIGDIFGEEAGYAAGQVVELTSAIGGFATAASKFTSGDILGGITSVVTSVASIFSMGKKVKEMNAAARAEVQEYYDTALDGEREYLTLLRERQRTQQEIGESALAYNKRITAELAKQQQDTSAEQARLMEQIQGEQYVSGKGYKHGTWFRKAKTWDEYSSLAGKSYEDIEKLYSEGKLDEKVSKLFEQLRTLKEEGGDINQMLADQDEAMREALTGTTTDSIADSILQGFAQGKRSAADFADDFQAMLNNAVLQGIKMKALEEPLRKWYENFAVASGNGLTADSIADLKSQYDKIIADAAKQLEDMEAVTGMPIGAEAGRQAVAKGIGASITQDSANELNGNFYALLIYADKTSTAVSNINTVLVEGLTVLNRIAANTDRLEAIENYMKTMSSNMQQMLNKGLIMRKN